MDNNVSFTRGNRGLRWKLTLSYTTVTVGALITVEIILLAAVSVLVFALVNSGILPAQLIETTSISYTPALRIYLSQTPPDVDGLAASLEQLAATSASLPLAFEPSERLFVIAPDGQILAAQPADLFGAGQIGKPFDTQVIPGLDEPLQAALAGEDDPYKLFTFSSPGDQVVLTIPIWDADHEQVLGVLGGLADFPTLTSILGDALPVLGVSLLLLTLVAGLIGTLFGYLAARGPVRRLNRLSEATQAWSRGDFSEFVGDAEGDELGQLAQQLNHMAQELEQLLETRQELAVIEERNRLARELHDSAKQQAFAAAAQVSGVRTLISRDPAAAEGHLIEAENIIDQLRQELTNLIFELRPAALDSQGLAPALEVYATRWSRQNNIGSELRLKGKRSLPLEIEQALFRIVQEALANVARHSLAGNVEITLLFNLDHLILTVSDDGQGFDPKSQPTGFGLRSMKQRAEALGGQFTIDAAPGHGATLTCNVPIPESNGNGREEAHG
ncbi:MAG: HAMP domain-containing protein [Chloroflexi bacterium]|nr:HAMP domain-containing protein [Chloroflexota bacterium]